MDMHRDQQDLATLLIRVVATARAAGALASSYHGNANLDKWEKQPGDPVSEADLAVDGLLKARLTSLIDGCGWGSEESHDESRLAHDWVWLVDPIDGTRAFIRGDDQWCVSIALAYKGEPQLAVVHAPQLDKTWTALAGLGAILNGAPVAMSATDDLSQATMGGNIEEFRSKLWPIKWPDSMAGKPVKAIALRLCEMTAPEGDAPVDCCVSLRPKHDWDLAAAALVLREAGGCITTGTGDALSFNSLAMRHDSLIASNKALYPAILERMKPAMAKRRAAASAKG